MGKKIAQFQFVDQHGTSQNALMTWKGCDADIEDPGSVRFAVYENEAEYARQNKKAIAVMPITPIKVLEMFNRSGNVALEISDISWQMAQSTKFFWSRNPVTFKMEQYSLAELNANIIDIG